MAKPRTQLPTRMVRLDLDDARRLKRVASYGDTTIAKVFGEVCRPALERAERATRRGEEDGSRA